MPADGSREYRSAMIDRTALLLGVDAVRRLEDARVLVIGLGGVGSWCAEALARTGIGRLTIVDHDLVAASNINRQAQAVSGTVGAPKAEALAVRLREINPHANIDARIARYTAKSAGEFDLGAYDRVVDAIDSIDDKIALIAAAVRSNATLYSSMGAASRIDPTRVRIAPLSKTHGCPLARVVRRRLKIEGIQSDFLCVYSDEPATDAGGQTERCEDDGGRRKRVNGSLVQVTAVFGFALAGLVVNGIAGRGSV
jgi:tRNA A37 threonylcarbamoyladenosine dehydratase